MGGSLEKYFLKDFFLHSSGRDTEFKVKRPQVSVQYLPYAGTSAGDWASGNNSA